MPSDGLELIRRIAGGDRDAFSAFYDASAPLAFGLIRRILRSDAEAEEVLLEVFWEVWQSAGDWDPRRGSPEAWVVGRAETISRASRRTWPAAPSASGCSGTIGRCWSVWPRLSASRRRGGRRAT